MEKELVDRFLNLGVAKSALEIYGRPEMWEEVVKCYRSIEQRDRAHEIVHDLLARRKVEADVVLARGRTNPYRHTTRSRDMVPPRRPRFLLIARALGDITLHEEKYSAANATALQPLLSRPWFLMGCAHVREEAWVEARGAFARCVGIDQDDGESWNNIASVYLRMDEKGLAGGDDLTTSEDNSVPEATTDNKFTNKPLAFRTLKQGLRYSHENWRIRQNYIIVSINVGELYEACRALGRLAEP
ncbi:unnamed protein product [Rhizoctonia solani]|uniref:Uncharacterized protein n=1 Tax=Rhizoctonia solani TaxID=456999 RepID=A0A8H2ZZF7_9AGAM|nr:unnamed protein product [Rhizoctonia solani]CAE6418298.1 unnamed protein product [Rhizoctonia solani]